MTGAIAAFVLSAGLGAEPVAAEVLMRGSVGVLRVEQQLPSRLSRVESLGPAVEVGISFRPFRRILPLPWGRWSFDAVWLHGVSQGSGDARARFDRVRLQTGLGGMGWGPLLVLERTDHRVSGPTRGASPEVWSLQLGVQGSLQGPGPLRIPALLRIGLPWSRIDRQDSLRFAGLGAGGQLGLSAELGPPGLRVGVSGFVDRLSVSAGPNDGGELWSYGARLGLSWASPAPRRDGPTRSKGASGLGLQSALGLREVRRAGPSRPPAG